MAAKKPAKRKPTVKKSVDGSARAGGAAPRAISMPMREFTAEHRRLLKVLRSASHADDKAEFKKQAAEVKSHKKPVKKSPARRRPS